MALIVMSTYLQELSVSKNVCAEDVDGQDSNLREGNNCVGNSNDKGDRTASNYLKLGKFDLIFLFEIDFFASDFL